MDLDPLLDQRMWARSCAEGHGMAFNASEGHAGGRRCRGTPSPRHIPLLWHSRHRPGVSARPFASGAQAYRWWYTRASALFREEIPPPPITVRFAAVDVQAPLWSP